MIVPNGGGNFFNSSRYLLPAIVSKLHRADQNIALFTLLDNKYRVVCFIMSKFLLQFKLLSGCNVVIHFLKVVTEFDLHPKDWVIFVI